MKRPIFKKIAIVGMGLIGGSLGIGIRKRGLAGEVVGIVRRPSRCRQVLKEKACHRASLELREIEGAELVILATPVSVIMDFLKRLRPYLAPGMAVMDVGSTKSQILKAAARFLPAKVEFVGAHPLAGSEQRGIEHASASLFQGSLCLLCPGKGSRRETIRKAAFLWRSLGADIELINPWLHDRILASTSHLPHLLSYALMESVKTSWLRYAATGLRDTTRLASSDHRLWTDVFLSNQGFLLESLEDFTKCIARLKRFVKVKDHVSLCRQLEKIKKKSDVFRTL